jgi:hypothetical protein
MHKKKGRTQIGYSSTYHCPSWGISGLAWREKSGPTALNTLGNDVGNRGYHPEEAGHEHHLGPGVRDERMGTTDSFLSNHG